MSTPTHSYELVDASNDETYYTFGIWLSLEEAIAAVEGLGDNPRQLGESLDWAEEYIELEIRERKVGWGGSGHAVWARSWVRDFNEEAPMWKVHETKTKADYDAEREKKRAKLLNPDSRTAE